MACSMRKQVALCTCHGLMLITRLCGGCCKHKYCCVVSCAPALARTVAHMHVCLYIQKGRPGYGPATQTWGFLGGTAARLACDGFVIPRRRWFIVAVGGIERLVVVNRQWTLHYTTLHPTTLLFARPHYTALHCIILHHAIPYPTLHYTYNHHYNCNFNYSTLHYSTLHYTSYSTLHYNTFHYATLRFTTFYYTLQHYTRLSPSK